jgi:excisionase family DNA binding protein
MRSHRPGAPGNSKKVTNIVDIQPKLLTISQLTKSYGLSRSGTYRAIASGAFEAVKVGRSTFVLRDSVDQYLRTLPRLGQKASS